MMAKISFMDLKLYIYISERELVSRGVDINKESIKIVYLIFHISIWEKLDYKLSNRIEYIE